MDFLKLRARPPQLSPIQITYSARSATCDLHHILGRVGIGWAQNSAVPFKVSSHGFAFRAEFTKVKWFAVGAEEEHTVEALQ